MSFVAVQNQLVPAGSCFENPVSGISFSQIDFVFANATVLNSYCGVIEVNVANLTGSLGLQQGYVNVFTDAGWVVQDMVIDSNITVPRVAMYFNLGVDSGIDVTSLSAHLQYSSNATANFTDGPRVNYAVTTANYNAEGVGDALISNIPQILRPISIVDPSRFVSFYKKLQLANENVQCAWCQCFPMALANSLQYLENKYSLPVPHDHVIGLKGDNSLVGQLDTYTGRYAPSRTVGSGIGTVAGLTGLVDYLYYNGILNRVTISYQTDGFYGGGGDFVRDGITVPDESVNGHVTYDWIKTELYNCESLVIGVSWYGGGGHCVRVYGCGESGGVPFLWYADDRLQTNAVSDPTDTQGLEWVQVYVPDNDGDGNPDFGPSTRNEIRLAISISRIWLVLVDINVDGKVDMRDIGISASAFGAYARWAFYCSPNPASPRWNSDADVNRDGKDDMKDIGSVCRNFGGSITPWP
jgi:hypothetical protein